MEEKLTGASCAQFSAALASAAPTPGGGGASALVGALGAALCAMAGNLTLGKKKYAQVEPDIRRMIGECEAVRQRLLELVDEDARAFAPLAQAYAIPRDDPRRGEVLEQATLEACRAPVEMMEQICRSIGLLEEMLEKGSAMLVSDVGCGAACARAALDSAALNVLVNTRSLADRERARELDRRVDELLEGYIPRAEGIVEAVNARLRSK